MSIGLTVRSTGRGIQAGRSRPGLHPESPSRLQRSPPAEAVTAVAGAADASNDTPGASLSDASHVRDIILDPHSREVIDRSVNAGLPRVVHQTPEVAARRLKAYTRFAKGKALPHEHQADIET